THMGGNVEQQGVAGILSFSRPIRCYRGLRRAGGGLSASRLVAALFAVALVCLLPVASASAAAPTLVGEFACDATNPCDGDTSWAPRRLTVDEATGDVYVVDEANDAVERFDSEG